MSLKFVIVGGLAPSSQTVGSIFRSPGWQSQPLNGFFAGKVGLPNSQFDEPIYHQILKIKIESKVGSYFPILIRFIVIFNPSVEIDSFPENDCGNSKIFLQSA